jgi:small subunit ribosomal protein S17
MKKILTGKVVSVQPKTAIVEVSRKIAHPLYKKLLTRSKRYKVDSTRVEVKLGDEVRIAETRKMAKDKYFFVESIVPEKHVKGGK